MFLLTCLLRGMTGNDGSLTSISSFLLTCLLRGMTCDTLEYLPGKAVSTHMPLARHDALQKLCTMIEKVSTHMPLARHDREKEKENTAT